MGGPYEPGTSCQPYVADRIKKRYKRLLVGFSHTVESVDHHRAYGGPRVDLLWTYCLGEERTPPIPPLMVRPWSTIRTYCPLKEDLLFWGRSDLLLSPSYGQQRVTLGVDGQHRVNRTYVPDSTPLTPLNKGLKGNSRFRLYDHIEGTGDAPEEEGNALRIWQGLQA